MLYTCVSLSLVWVLLGLAQGFSVQYESDAFFPTEFGRGDSPSTDYTMNTQKRYGISRDCHRCMFRRDDWTSCLTCYGRPGPVPFYGGFAKRSIDPTMPGEEVSPYRGEGFPHFAEKRALDDCRCCLRAPSTNLDCCRNCNMTPFYAGGYGKRSMEKRGYETSFAPLGTTGGGSCETCCSGLMFDFYCCVFRCGEKRRK